eukprot:1244446-Amorphochlora_amoeboformis.AAC.1
METRPLVPRVVPLTHRGAAKIFRRADPRILVLMVAALGLITLISASGEKRVRIRSKLAPDRTPLGSQAALRHRWSGPRLRERLYARE